MTLAIGMFRPKDYRNLHDLIKTAGLFEVDFTFQIGGASAPAWEVPHKVYDTEVQFLNDQYLGGLYRMGEAPRLVAIEMDARASLLGQYEHPEHAIYLLGPNGGSIPADLLAWAKEVVQIETASQHPLDSATAGAIVLHDRHIKERISA